MELLRIPLVFSDQNEEQTSSATSFSSFLKEYETQRIIDDEMSMNMMIKCVFVSKSCIL